ncbi:MAG: fibronectin type III domain-containing protein [Verrucomicrobia bacterium]|nr:fibronectin type III domain-containing protein [Verrucomicrobiota bacterium]
MAKIRRNFSKLTFEQRFQLMKSAGDKVSTLAAYAAAAAKGTALKASGNTLETKRNTRDTTAQLAQTQTAELDGLDTKGMEDLDSMASTLEGISTAPDFLLGAGFEIVTGTSTPVTLIAPPNLVVKMGTMPATLKGKFGPVPGAKSFRVQYATNPNGPWTESAVVTKRSFTIAGLTSGTKYYVRVIAIGKDGDGPPSNIEEMMAP